MQTSRYLRSRHVVRRLAELGTVMAAAACSAATVPARSEATVSIAPTPDTIRYAPANVNLSANYATGSGSEPTVRRMTLATECNVSPALWLLQQDGDSVRLFTFERFHGQGVPSSPVSHNIAAGRVSGLDITMDGPGARFVLRYDTTSGHLRGTLNGAPFWAAPLDVVQPERCVAIP